MQQYRNHQGGFHLPHHLTTFIGRENELAEITQILADPACRLLTLTGPGGMGKTRLAIQAAAEKIQSFHDGVFFVDLQPLVSPEFLLPATADALGLSLSAQQSPQDQIVAHLADKELLLLFDNFEHVLSCANVVAELLEATPAVKVLVTSREALNLQAEWFYPVGGMPFPQLDSSHSPMNEDSGQEVVSFSAVQLFFECARRVRPDFTMTAEENDVARICSLVEGMPLAIELAASWCKSLNARDIGDEIQRSIEFLSTNMRNVPERHRNMQAVFDHSWQMLSGKQQDVFKQLSVFRGGFSRLAARAVADAPLPVLAELLDKSLLWRDAGGRYRIHELLRQHAKEQLARSPEELSRAHDLHCRFYGDFLHQRFGDFMGDRQREVAVEVEEELENIRAAWHWAVERLKVEELQNSAQSFFLFCQFGSRYLEGANALERAAQALDCHDSTEQTELALAAVLVPLGWLKIRLGLLNEAEGALERCQVIYESLDVPRLPGEATDPLIPLGIIATIYGDYPTAAQLGEQALVLSKAQGHQANRMFADHLLTRAALLQDDPDAALLYAQQAYQRAEEKKDRWFMAYCLNELGNVECALGDFAAAKSHYETSYVIRKEFRDPAGMALALTHLGEVALCLQSYLEAQGNFQQSLMIYQEVNDKGGIANSLNGLGIAALQTGDLGGAQHNLYRALEIAVEIQFVPLVLSVLSGVGEVFFKVDRREQAIECLSLLLKHPASDPKTKGRVNEILTRFDALPELSAVTGQADSANNLETIVQAVKANLSALTLRGQAYSVGEERAAIAADQGLVEPLTERELEILKLISDGLTNQQVADNLIISVGTVKWYTSQIYGKLSTNSRTQAVTRARQLQLLP